MKANFFEKELSRLQQRFNQTFGSRSVCDLQARAQVILAIIYMGRLGSQIMNARDKQRVRDDIRMFIRTRDVLAGIFNNAQKTLARKEAL